MAVFNSLVQCFMIFSILHFYVKAWEVDDIYEYDVELRLPKRSFRGKAADHLFKNTLTRPSFCNLQYDSGHCLAYMPRYYYDVMKGDCKQFIYGGCGGNGNRFYTLAECKKTCMINDYKYKFTL